MKRTKAKKIDDGVFETDTGIDTFGDKITEHPLLAEGAEVQQLSTESATKLEDDTGWGPEVILRTFEFSANPETPLPSAQILFNSHLKGIEGMLWADGLKPADDIEPRLVFAKNRKGYRIFVACRPMLGQTVLEKPRTLSELAKPL